MANAFKLFPTRDTNYLEATYVHHDLNVVWLKLSFRVPLETLFLEYRQQGGHTLILSRQVYENILVRDTDFMSVFCNDLQAILEDSPAIERFFVELSPYYWGKEDFDKRMSAWSQSVQLYDWLVTFLDDRQEELKLKLVSLCEFTSLQILSIIRLISSNYLETIKLTFRKNDEQLESNFQEILKTKQWNNAKAAYVKGCCTPIASILHFQKATVQLDILSIDDLRVLKELATKGTLNIFKIRFHSIADSITDNSLIELFGESKHSFLWEWSINGIDNREIECIYSKTYKEFSIFYSEEYQKLGHGVPENNKSEETTLCTSEHSSKVLQNALLMKNILNHLERKDICRLQRTSRKIHESIANLKPDSKIVALEISLVKIECVTVNVFHKMGVKKLIYENVGLSNVDPTAKLITAMERHNQGVFGEEICFAHGRWQLGFSLSAFAVDLIRNLKDQKSEIQELWLDFSLTQARLRERPDKEHIKILVLATRQLLDVISSAGKTLDRQIPVKKLSIQALGHKPLLQILPLLNPVTLKTIEIQKSEVIMAKKPLNLNKVVQLDQWKNAEEVLIKSITAPGQIQHFLHFVVAEVNLESISMGDVLELKNVFQQNSNKLKKFKAFFENSDIDERIYDDQFLGFPYKRPENPSTNLPSVWFVRIPTSTVLHILYYKNRKMISFSRVSNSSVPSDALM